MREGTIQSFPKFPNQWSKWLKWEKKVKNAIGSNGWHQIVFGTQPLVTPRQINNNSTIFYHLNTAVEGIEAEHVLAALIPPDKDPTPADG